MALQRDTFGPYSGRWNAATAPHPQGSFKNLTTPGDVRVQAGGTGTHVITGSFPESNPVSLAVDSSNGSIYVLDLSTQELYLLDEGVGTFQQLGNKEWVGSLGVAVNSSNGDLWVADGVGGKVWFSAGVPD